MGARSLLPSLLGVAVALRPQPTRREVAVGAAALAGLPRAATGAASTTLGAPATSSTVKLLDDSIFPLASFGLQIYDDDTAEKLTLLAIEAGFRNFFASVLARNQVGFARAVKRSGVPREELFICGSVVSNRAMDADTAYKLTKLGCDENMQAFSAGGGITQLDMIMLDYPGPTDECIRAQWQAFEEMQESGLVRSLAVSNFSPQQLDVVCGGRRGGSSGKGGGGGGDGRRVTQPVVNQLPLCVGYHDPGLIAANARRGIHAQAWSPLGNGRLTRFSRDAPAIKELCAEIGTRYAKSPYQVALRWLLDAGASFTVEARTAAHFAEDLGVFDFALTQGEMAALEELNRQPSFEGSVTAPNA